jgi:amidase
MDLPELTIAETQAACARGEWTSVRLCEAYLQRIAAIDQAGPMLRSVIEINPDALEIAARLDAERAQQGPRFGAQHFSATMPATRFPSRTGVNQGAR